MAFLNFGNDRIKNVWVFKIWKFNTGWVITYKKFMSLKLAQIVIFNVIVENHYILTSPTFVTYDSYNFRLCYYFKLMEPYIILL